MVCPANLIRFLSVDPFLGTVAHLSFTFLAVVNNLLNTINMILGASAAISFL